MPKIDDKQKINILLGLLGFAAIIIIYFVFFKKCDTPPACKVESNSKTSGKTGNTGNTGSSMFTNVSRFGDILGTGGVTVISDENRNMLDFQFKYTVPSIPASLPASIGVYKWPLLYLINPISGPTGGASLNAAWFNTVANNYLRPSPKGLLNEDNSYYPNLINLNVLLVDSGATATTTNLLPHPSVPFNVSGEKINAGSGGWILPGLSSIVTEPLVPGTNYVLGIAIQLTMNYVNASGLPENEKQEPITRRYGNFTYIDLAYSLSGLSVIVPDGVTPSEPTFSLIV